MNKIFPKGGMRLAGPLAILVVLAGGWTACSEKETSFAVDADELRSFVNFSTLGKDFFRVDSMIIPTPFQIPNDTTHYYDSVIGHERNIGIDTSKSNSAGLADWGTLGMVREALARVEDRYTVVRRAVNNSSFAPDTSLRVIYRYGFFLKLADDTWPYLGWDLFGYAGFASTTTVSLPMYVPIAVRASDNTPLGTFYGDNSMLTFHGKIVGKQQLFVEIRDLISRGPGNKFYIETNLSTQLVQGRYFYTITASQPTGRTTEAMTQVTREQYIDTVILPTTRQRLYDFLFIQAFDDTSNGFYRAWCVPYKTP